MMAKKLYCIVALLISTGLVRGQTPAEDGLALAPVFADHMVFQRNKPIVIYGHGTAGSEIQVYFLKHTLATTTDRSGKWKVVFPAVKHGGPYHISVATKYRKIVVNDVLIGDVWLCSGQSNMEFALQDAKTGPEELKTGQFDSRMRLLKMSGRVSTGNFKWDSTTLAQINRFEFFSGTWKTLNSASATSFSAIAYYFGKKIAAEEDIPIGLIQVAVGGSPTESWIEHQLLERDQQFAGMLNDWQNSPAVMEWCRQRAAVNFGGVNSTQQKHPYQPGYNFQAGIAPLTDFPIAGVIWYQGESNVHNIPLHEVLLKTLVTNWRQRWRDEFPFYYVQLSSIDRVEWPEFRDSQRKLLTEIPKSGMAVSYDVGDSLNVHPTPKREVGERLALLALHNTYRRNVAAQGPIPVKAVLKDGSVAIHFKSARKLKTKSGEPLAGFEWINSEGKRKPANAQIRGKQVLLSVPPGEHIDTILYAYRPFTRANFYNEAGLPAPTFSIAVK